MNPDTKQLHLYLSICLRCQTLPVKTSSWQAGGDPALPYCLICGEEVEVMRMSIAIPVSLLNDKAYSGLALRGATEL
jgi:transcription elongation factor Elf1